MSKLELARIVALSHLGTFYKWGGDDPSGFDCSGLCIEILKSVGLFPRTQDTTAQGLFNKYRSAETAVPFEGCLVLYQNKARKIIHVEYCLDSEFTIGASGGGSRTKTEADAIRDNAYIKIRPINERRGPIYVNPFQGV